MFVKEFEEIEIVLKTKKQCLKWTEKLGYTPYINKPFLVHWSKLTTTTFRRLKLKVKCDGCNNIIERDTRNFNINSNYHLCNSCLKLGDKNPQFGKPKTKTQKENHKKWMKENGNPFSWDSVKLKLKDKQTETTRKTVSKIIGLKRSEETRKKMSESIKKAYKTGILKSGNGYNNIKCKLYKNIIYQGSYELNFLKFVEKYNKLNIITRGPRIPYFINDVEHTYIVDYMIKDTDIIFEIKSSYYWKKHKEINTIKMEYAKQDHIFNLVMDNNFNEIEKYFK